MSDVEYVHGDWWGAGGTVIPAVGSTPRHVVAANELRCTVFVRVCDTAGADLGGVLLAPGAFVDLVAGMEHADGVAVSCVVPPPVLPPQPKQGLMGFWHKAVVREAPLTAEEVARVRIQEAQARAAAEGGQAWQRAGTTGNWWAA